MGEAIRLTDFLRVLHPPDGEGFIELRALPSTARDLFKPGDSEGIERFICANASENLYFGPATRRTRDSGKLENCGLLHNLFSDIDFKLTPEPEAMAKLERFLLKPSIVVRSGGGLHCYWLLQEPLNLQDPKDCARAKNLLRRLALALGGDLSSAEPARVLRIPRTLNRKPEYGTPRPVLIEAFNPERAYNPCDFDDVLPAEPEATTNGNGHTFTLPDEIAEGDPGRDNMLYRFGRKLKCVGLTEGEITDALIAANQERCKPPLPEEHVRETARHVATQPDRPDFTVTGNNNSGDPLVPLRALTESPTAADIEIALRLVVKSLAGVDGLRRATLRQETLSILKAKNAEAPAKQVDAAWVLIADKGGTNDTPADFLADPEPWPESVDGAVLLDGLSHTLRRYMVMKTEEADFCALWIVFAHSHDAYAVSPIFAIQSPEKECGKSRLESILVPMLPRALPLCNAGAATLFRTIEKYNPTLVIDEADTFMKDNEELLGIINSGWLRSLAQTVRLVGDNYDTQTFSTWCPKVIASIGTLPDTTQSRAIVLTLKRKASGEHVEEFSQISTEQIDLLTQHGQQAARWAADHLPALREARPSIPDGITSDRTRDNWRPLLAIADLAGADWPVRVRKAAQELSGGERDPEADGAGVTLIADCVATFKKRKADRLSTTDLIAELVKLEERPWPEWSKGKHITPRGLAKLLKPFRIKPKVLRIGDETPSGYELEGFKDAHFRYVQGSNPQHCQHINKNNELDPAFNPQQTPHVEDTKSDLSIEKHDNVEDVEDRNPENRGTTHVTDDVEATDPEFETRLAADLDDLFNEEVTVL